MGHILGPKSHVSIATLVEFLLAITMKICDLECGLFQRMFAVFPILGKTYLPGARNLARRNSISCSILPRVNRPTVSYLLFPPSPCYATSGACHVDQFCLSCCFLPPRVSIHHALKPQCTEPEGISRPVKQGLD